MRRRVPDCARGASAHPHSAFAVQHRFAGFAEVVSIASIDFVGSVPADEPVVSVTTLDVVVAPKPVQFVSPRTPAQHVISKPAGGLFYRAKMVEIAWRPCEAERQVNRERNRAYPCDGVVARPAAKEMIGPRNPWAMDTPHDVHVGARSSEDPVVAAAVFHGIGLAEARTEVEDVVTAASPHIVGPAAI